MRGTFTHFDAIYVSEDEWKKSGYKTTYSTDEMQL